MIDGLPDEVVRELRERFPRTQIAELVSRIAAFPRECFASAAYLAAEIGRSSRTVFRYFARGSAEGWLERRWGSRELHQMPKDSQPGLRLALRAHGYKLTGFGGWLAPEVARGRSIVADRKRHKRAKAHRKREAEQRERRAQAARANAEWSEQFPAIAKQARERGASPEYSRDDAASSPPLDRARRAPASASRGPPE